MAPVTSNIPDLGISSLELDPRSEPFDAPTSTSFKRIEVRDALEAPSKHLLNARAAVTRPADHSGAVDPNAINMKGVQAAFALIGVFFVVLCIWFFFWAKNGGFQWKKNDWEEYKSTVLRRKGPNGTTLSNATKSTKLGGGSVVGHGYSDDGSSWTGATETMTDLSSEAPVIKEKRKAKANAKAAKIRQINGEQWEGGHDDDVRAYRHEKPAKVGGINRDSEAKFYGTDYTGSESRSQVNQSRRDFSYGAEDNFSAAPQHEPAPPRVPRHSSPSKPRTNRQSVPGNYTEPLDFSDTQSQNTKSYHHPIPGLSKGANAGFRRGRDDPLAD
jgi:hypothetical protein